MKNSLAIVIPAYKGAFLGKVLECLALQTDKRFDVYVGDDKSPDDIASICQQYSERLNIHYTRFDDNLGSQSLVKQWNRCVRLSDQPWVWLLSDDDEIDTNCIEQFYSFHATGIEVNLLRFDTQVIDSNSEIIRDNVLHPDLEYAIDFVLNRMAAKRSSYVSEYIFKRSVFDKHQGFVEFPCAWCSDDGSWVQFSETLPIAKINGAKVQWRTSELNISAVNSPHSFAKIDASLQYIQWLLDVVFVPENSTHKQREELLSVSKIWFSNLIWKLSPYFNLQQRRRIAKKMLVIYNSQLEAKLTLWKSNLRFGLKKIGL